MIIRNIHLKISSFWDYFWVSYQVLNLFFPFFFKFWDIFWYLIFEFLSDFFTEAHKHQEHLPLPFWNRSDLKVWFTSQKRPKMVAFLNVPAYGFKTIRNGFSIKFYVPMTFFGHKLKLFFSVKEKKSHFWTFWFWVAILRPILI